MSGSVWLEGEVVGEGREGGAYAWVDGHGIPSGKRGTRSNGRKGDMVEWSQEVGKRKCGRESRA